MAGRRLARAGIDTARMDARLLLAEATGLTAESIFAHPGRPLVEAQAGRFEGLVERRRGRQPMAQILGRREFWSLAFKVTEHTLTPRPDSEILVEAAAGWLDGREGGRNAPVRVLDLGTGTGCLLLALLSEFPGATGVGLDVSPRALEVARENARDLGMEKRTRMIQGDWRDGLSGSYEVVFLNPPYIPDRDLEGLEPEVSAFEPRLALAGGPDGLESYRIAISSLAQVLPPGGLAVIEIGLGQAPAVAEISQGNNLQVIEIKKDLANIPRCVLAVCSGA